jgi:hypothetical protein
MALAKRMQQGTRDMLIAREGEEIVCPKVRRVQSAVA